VGKGTRGGVISDVSGPKKGRGRIVPNIFLLALIYYQGKLLPFPFLSEREEERKIFGICEGKGKTRGCNSMCLQHWGCKKGKETRRACRIDIKGKEGESRKEFYRNTTPIFLKKGIGKRRQLEHHL